MTTNITALAQREKFEAWVITQICISKSTLEGLRTSDGYRNSTLSGRDYNLMWNLWKAAGAELVEALEKAQRANAAQDDHINQQQDRIESLEKKNAELGKYAGGLESFRTAYMEWSDKTDWVQKDKRFDFLKPWGKHRADVLKAYIEHLESRTVKLPKPHAHLIWIQAGHAPDDYWDDVAVSHSEKDLCCDGSERYPVCARWEIEEMLAAAGIKVEQLS